MAFCSGCNPETCHSLTCLCSSRLDREERAKQLAWIAANSTKPKFKKLGYSPSARFVSC